MSAHVYDWQPVAGECARYACTCGAQGRRLPRGGEVVPARYQRAVAAPSVTSRVLAAQQEEKLDGGRRVRGLPTLDQQERDQR